MGEVEVLVDSAGQLWWKNHAGAQWTLSLSEGVLAAGSDCPYGPSELGIELLEAPSSALFGLVDSLFFNGEPYHRVWAGP